MPRISTDNYDTVASWNGSQDLFVVEQPDGTKVATPAMVKQFIEAGDFEVTGEITDGHGNILKDMAKSADVNTALAGKQDTLTFDNAPTKNSTNPVKSGGVFDSISGLSGNYALSQYTDFNDLPHGSIVQVPGQLAHVPGPTGHYYIVFTYFIAGTTTFKTQFAIENTDGNIYTRDCLNGTWGNWNKFAKT